MSQMSKKLVFTSSIDFNDYKNIDKEEKVNIKQKNLRPNNNTIFSPKTIKRTQEFIEREEGLRLKAYKDTGGVWTIGYGHTKNVKPDDKITKEEAEKFFIEDIQEHITPLKNVKISLSENEKIALVSFIYNVGPNAFLKSTLLKKLNNNDKQGAAEEFNKWIYDNGKIQNGLIKRRTNEKNLFLKKD